MVYLRRCSIVERGACERYSREWYNAPRCRL